MGLLLTVHWYESSPSLEPGPGATSTVNTAGEPEATTWRSGCVAIAGATFTRRAASALVVDVVVPSSVLVTTTE
jgi:hypothetical protein